MADATIRRWHQALTFAITGQRWDSLDEHDPPDVRRLLDAVQSRVPLAELTSELEKLRRRGDPWPYPVPADLMTGLGYAQFAAALAMVQAALRGRGVTPPAIPKVTADRPPTADERRLHEDVPPHHGT